MTTYTVTTDCSAETYINGKHIEADIFNGFLNGSDPQKVLAFIPEKFHTMLVNLETAMSYGIGGIYGDVSDESRAIIENAVAKDRDCSDLIIVRKDGSISAPYHDSADFELLCEFLLWHQELIDANTYAGLDPFVFWTLSTILDTDDSEQAIKSLPELECMGVFYIGSSEYSDDWENGKRDPVTFEVEACLKGEGMTASELHENLKTWLAKHNN